MLTRAAKVLVSAMRAEHTSPAANGAGATISAAVPVSPAVEPVSMAAPTPVDHGLVSPRTAVILALAFAMALVVGSAAGLAAANAAPHAAVLTGLLTGLAMFLTSFIASAAGLHNLISR